MNCYGFYHIYCSNDWMDVFLEQVELIRNSKIMNDVHKIFLTIIYKDENDCLFIEKNLTGVNYEISYKTTTDSEYEFPTLKKIKTVCKNEECYIFYIHTKGTSINEKNLSFYHRSVDLNHLKSCVKDWREYMGHFIIKNHKQCIDVLKNYDACGVNLRELPSKHFSGNFWWSKSNYINKLPNIESLNIGNRWEAEFWIGRGNGSLYSLHNEDNAGYLNRIDKENYLLN